ncbi:MAG: VWA domain-containing protein [Henriciella sp.]|nr:VWA domain-containing protein [Henriciella sp.]
MRVRIKTASVLIGVLGLSASSDAQILVSDLEPKGEVNLSLTPVEQFQQDLDLYGPQFGIVEHVSKTGDPRLNRSVTDTNAGLTFISRLGDLSVKRIEDSADGEPRYVLSLKDGRTSMPRRMRPNDIHLIDQNANDVAFRLSPFTNTNLPVSVVIMLDASGSMNGYMPQVVSAANALYDELPEHFRCEALAFESEHTWYGSPSLACNSRNVSIPAIQANGGTNLFTAMAAAYRRLNTRPDDVIKTLIVLTDGAPGDRSIRSEAQAQKGDVQTIFIWLGDKSQSAESQFLGLADAYVDDPEGAWRHLDQIFSVYSDALSKQSVLTVSGNQP